MQSQAVFGRKRPLSLHQRAIFHDKVEGLQFRGLDFLASRDQALCLEIGLGYGEHFARCVEQNPPMAFIGVEPYLYGCVQTFRQLASHDYARVRLAWQSVWAVFPLLPDGCLSQIFLLHPDPWPKKRHSHRRVFSQDFLEACARCMKPRAQLTVATDHPVYQQWVRDLSYDTDTWDVHCQNWPDYWPLTRYGLKAKKEGRTTIVWNFTYQGKGQQPG